MKILIIADPIPGLTASSDTGLSILREALLREHSVHWATDADLQLSRNRLWVRAAQVTSCAEGELPAIQPADKALALEHFDNVWIRKDPPFNPDYLSLCWLLSLEEKNIPMINPPSVLLRYHEKLLPYEALRAGYIQEAELVPSFMATGEQHTGPTDFPEGEIITKPWLGYGGRDVEKWNSIDEALQSSDGPDKHFTLFQPFLPQVMETGDRRVLFIDGEYAGDVVRLPPEGSIRANLVQGARAELREMTPQENELTKRIGKFLKSVGILLAGADYIDGLLTEINITAPTGFEAVAGLGQKNPRIKYVDLAEQLANNRSHA